MFIIKETFRALFPSSDIETTIFSLQGIVFKQNSYRKTLSFEKAGKLFFAKLHYGVGWKEIFKNLFQLKWPVVNATTEWRAIHRLLSLQIPTTPPVALGCFGHNPATQRSVLITEAIQQAISLEKVFCESQISSALKYAIIRSLAKTARMLHENGINHRDFYLCHFLMDQAAIKNPAAFVKLYVIDLHRAQIRKKIPKRYQEKDLAGLYFSSFPGVQVNKKSPFTMRDYYRFMESYSQKSLRDTLTQDKNLWAAVSRKAHALYHKIEAKKHVAYC